MATRKKYSKYILGNKSLGQLVGVKPDLIALIVLALKLSKSDFTVFDGIRGQRQQEYMLSHGVSKSKNSYHLYGLAADLVPWIDGKPRWDSTDPEMQTRIDKAFADINKAMKEASKILQIPVDNGFDLWGWDKPHWQLTGQRQYYDIRKLSHEL